MDFSLNRILFHVGTDLVKFLTCISEIPKFSLWIIVIIIACICIPLLLLRNHFLMNVGLLFANKNF